MLVLSGSSPLHLEFEDGSDHDYELDDPILLAAIETGEETELDMGANAVPFVVLYWPEDLQAELNGEALTLNQVSQRFTSFMAVAIHQAVRR